MAFPNEHGTISGAVVAVGDYSVNVVGDAQNLVLASHVTVMPRSPGCPKTLGNE